MNNTQFNNFFKINLNENEIFEKLTILKKDIENDIENEFVDLITQLITDLVDFRIMSIKDKQNINLTLIEYIDKYLLEQIIIQNNETNSGFLYQRVKIFKYKNENYIKLFINKEDNINKFKNIFQDNLIDFNFLDNIEDNINSEIVKNKDFFNNFYEYNFLNNKMDFLFSWKENIEHITNQIPSKKTREYQYRLNKLILEKMKNDNSNFKDTKEFFINNKNGIQEIGDFLKRESFNFREIILEDFDKYIMELMFNLPNDLAFDLINDFKLINDTSFKLKDKFIENILYKNRGFWRESLTRENLMFMLNNHNHKFIKRGYYKKDALDLIGISMMIYEKSN